MTTRRTRRRWLPVAALATILPIGAATAAQASRTEQASGGTRRIALEGVPNLRDLGGYETTDGRHVRWGRVFRSGQLAGLTEKDYVTIARLGIVAVCDFRRDDERAAQPSKWQGAGAPRVYALPGSPNTDGAPAADPVGLLRKGGTAEQVAQAMRDNYSSYPARFAVSYRRVIDLILADTGPVLYHCTAGKDRTGLFTALLLSMLGVPRETVYADYLLSNEYTGAATRPSDATRALLIVERDYLDAAFAAITRDYGSVDGYRTSALKLSDQELERLKTLLLTR